MIDPQKAAVFLIAATLMLISFGVLAIHWVLSQFGNRVTQIKWDDIVPAREILQAAQKKKAKGGHLTLRELQAVGRIKEIPSLADDVSLMRLLQVLIRFGWLKRVGPEQDAPLKITRKGLRVVKRANL
jgi:hypothetical protein